MHGTHYLDIIFCNGVKIPQSAIDSIGIYTQTILSLIRYLPIPMSPSLHFPNPFTSLL